jgi:hypothetical protein
VRDGCHVTERTSLSGGNDVGRTYPATPAPRLALRKAKELLSSVRPVDVTTPRTTPRLALSVIPSSTGVNLNGGVLRRFSSWRRLRRATTPHGQPRQTTPNRWLSVSRPVGPSSSILGRFPLFGGLPPPRAQENVEEKAQIPRTSTPAEMGRSTDADGERECARASPSDSLHRRLDESCFIDGLAG